MDKITKFMILTASIKSTLDSAGCGHSYFDDDINDHDLYNMFEDDNNDNQKPILTESIEARYLSR